MKHDLRYGHKLARRIFFQVMYRNGKAGDIIRQEPNPARAARCYDLHTNTTKAGQPAAPCGCSGLNVTNR